MKNSLKSNRDFQEVYHHGKSLANKYFVMYVCPREDENKKLGISVSKKVGNSVVRHHLTRLLREVFRLNEKMFNSGLNIVVIVRVNAKDISYKEVEQAFMELASRHKILEEQ